MQEFRRFTEGTLGKVILVLATLPFVALGFYGYFSSGGGANQIAKVGDQTITKQAVNNQLHQMRGRVRNANPSISHDMLARLVSPQMVLSGLINNALIDQAAADAYIVVPEATISRQVVKMPAFQDQNGNFSKNIFQQKLNRAGMSPAGFIKKLQQQTSRNQLKAGYELTNFATPAELSTQQSLTKQTRDISYVHLSLSDAVANTSITDTDAKSFYESHQGNYMRPPQVRIHWVEIKPDNYDIKVTKAQIKKEYEARIKVLEESAASNQQRKVADITIAINNKQDTAKAKALGEKIEQELASGGDFSALAKKYSNDPVTAKKGGELGWLQRKALPDSLAKAVFSLKKGEVTPLIKTDAGFHLMKVEGIRKQAAPSFAKMRDGIKKEISHQELLAKISQDSNQLGNLAYEHNDLSVPAQKLGLKVQTSDWFAPDNPTGFADNPQVEKALKDGSVMSGKQNSQLLNLGHNHYAVIHVAAHRDAAQQPFDKVKSTVETQLKVKKVQEAFSTLAKKAKKANSIADIASIWDSQKKQADGLTRNDKRLQPAVLHQVFSLPPHKSARPHVIHSKQGDLWAIAINQVTPGEKVPDKAKHSVLARMGVAEGKTDFNSYVNWLRSTGSIDINKEKLASIR